MRGRRLMEKNRGLGNLRNPSSNLFLFSDIKTFKFIYLFFNLSYNKPSLALRIVLGFLFSFKTNLTKAEHTNCI